MCLSDCLGQCPLEFAEFNEKEYIDAKLAYLPPPDHIGSCRVVIDLAKEVEQCSVCGISLRGSENEYIATLATPIGERACPHILCVRCLMVRLRDRSTSPTCPFDGLPLGRKGVEEWYRGVTALMSRDEIRNVLRDINPFLTGMHIASPSLIDSPHGKRVLRRKARNHFEDLLNANSIGTLRRILVDVAMVYRD